MSHDDCKWSTGNIPKAKTDVKKETSTGIITKGYENGPEAAGTGVGGPGAYPFNEKGPS